MRLSNAAIAPSLRRIAAFLVLFLGALAVSLAGGNSLIAADSPSASAVAVTSDAGGDDTYALGEIIRVTLTFSEAVDVTGTPQITIDMDPAEWGEKQAAYESGSGNNSLVFAHTVVEPNISTQGIAVLANSLALNGGSITSVSSQADASLAHSGLSHDSSHKVDWKQSPPAPSVSSVAITSRPAAGDTYRKDEIIRVAVSFTQAVAVTGAPQITIDMDPAEWGEKQAAYESGSGSATLTFTHTVVEPNISTQGIAAPANSLTLNGGTVESTATQTDADLSHSGLAHDSNHKVDWQQTPTPPAQTPPAQEEEEPAPSATPTVVEVPAITTCERHELDTLSAVEIERGMVVSWERPDVGICIITAYLIEIEKDGEKTVGATHVGDLSYTFEDIEGGDYTIRAWAWLTPPTVLTDIKHPPVYQLNVPSNCAVTLTLKAVGARTVHGSWTNAASAFGCEAGGVYIDWKKSTDTTWNSSFRVSNENEDFRNFLFGDMEATLYNFRVRTVDVRGLNVAEDDLQTAWIRTSSTVNITPNAPDKSINNIFPNAAGGVSVTWDSDAVANAARQVQVRVREKNTFDWIYSEFYAVAESTGGVAGLREGVEYWVEICVHENGEVNCSDPRDFVGAEGERYGVWFIDDTPNTNHAIGRIFMMVDSNAANSSASCDINGGVINCPPRTLVSLDVVRRGNYRMTATATSGTLWAQSYPDASGYVDAGGMLDIEVSAVGNKGTGATATSSINASGAVSITLTNGGSGYAVTPDVEISAPPMGGTQATATATMSNGVVTGITVNQAGSGYTAAPTVTLVEKNGKLVIAWHEGLTENIRQDDTNNDGSVDDADEKRYFESYILQWKPSSVSGWDDFNAHDHATAPFVITGRAGVTEVELGGDVRTYTVTGLPNGGYGVRIAPCTYVQGVQATATATISSGAVSAISVTRGGSRYSAAPDVTIDGSATGTAVLTNGVVTSVTIDSGGTGYTTAPTVTITAPTRGDGCLVPTTENGVTTHADVADSLRGVASGSHYITMDSSEVTVPGSVTQAGIQSTATGKITAWYNEPENNGGTRIHAYRFRLTPTGGTAIMRTVTPRVPAGIRSSKNFPAFTGLTSGVVYTVEIQAMNAAGAGPWTTVGTATPG